MPPESDSFMSSVPDWLVAVLPWLLLLLGASFIYKAVLAIFWGRTRYWHGFVPISIISPLFIHLPASERSPIKTTHQWWVHILLGPIFLFLGLGCLASGADLLGWEGTKSVNRMLTLGQEHVKDKDGKIRAVKPLIVFDREKGYSFPMVKRLKKHFVGIFNKPIFNTNQQKQGQVQGQAGEESDEDSE